ncbi:ribosome-binding factor A [Streptococcus gallolyticus subsp. gallolyticus]|uniref:Ribosome-binding factor A n=1 Tax=Streptococcus gallolyticus TaxID=315405 RepID=A0AA94M117_9STRE|nr:ribosome-binding factor A [Streptococcus gallolyticus]AQP41575.1 hypothetical protein BTR42_02890 [Streptococcus gallolyticus subsp. gallolyticus DSM 16831]MCF1633899.1 ribosome-binding factor A [Streptococcus gallolyticus]MCY7202842.1 ribosome-binding factor A [Streptococcus gallolyticus subsp. gallolyticus]WAW99528.1 ribosome-binding factor A [Streptococcus gallolyticus]SQG78862.1 ribosome-binding factor A [Streptococcus gallolyticus]
MIIENSILTEEQIKGIDEKYSHLKDTDVIESLGRYEMDSEQNNLVITEFPINKEDLIEISNQISNIQQEFERLKVMYKMFISDVFDFLKLNSELEKKNKVTNELDVNRFMMHLLSSGKLFVDFAENQIKTKHRQKFKKFHKLTSQQYDNSFAYRFCYNLRNFSQHVGIPISALHKKQDYVDDEKAIISLWIEKDYLLNSSFNWKKLRNEIEARNDIDAVELVKSYMEAITILYGEYNKFLLNIHHCNLINLKLSLENFGLVHKKYCIVERTKYNLKYNPANITTRPLLGLADIDAIYAHLSEIGIVKLVNKE